MSGNEQVRVEMQTFLDAVSSYPERFATNPRITFEEHRISLMTPGSIPFTQRRNAGEN